MTIQKIEVISKLLLQVDEAWLDHAERLRSQNEISFEDIQLEQLLFATGEWLEMVGQRSVHECATSGMKKTVVSSELTRR